MKITDILTEATIDSLSSMYNDQFTNMGQDPLDISTKLFQIDPTNNGKYTKWLSIRLIKGEWVIDVDNNIMRSLLVKFDENKTNTELPSNDINRYSVQELRTTLAELQPLTRKNKLNNSSDYFKSGQVSETFRNHELTIIELLTYEAMRFFGKKTTWCVAAGENGYFSGRQMFDEYTALDSDKLFMATFASGARYLISVENGAIREVANKNNVHQNDNYRSVFLEWTPEFMESEHPIAILLNKKERRLTAGEREEEFGTVYEDHLDLANGSDPYIYIKRNNRDTDPLSMMLFINTDGGWSTNDTPEVRLNCFEDPDAQYHVSIDLDQLVNQMTDGQMTASSYIELEGNMNVDIAGGRVLLLDLDNFEILDEFKAYCVHVANMHILYNYIMDFNISSNEVAESENITDKDMVTSFRKRLSMFNKGSRFALHRLFDDEGEPLYDLLLKMYDSNGTVAISLAPYFDDADIGDIALAQEYGTAQLSSNNDDWEADCFEDIIDQISKVISKHHDKIIHLKTTDGEQDDWY